LSSSLKPSTRCASTPRCKETIFPRSRPSSFPDAAAPTRTTPALSTASARWLAQSSSLHTTDPETKPKKKPGGSSRASSLSTWRSLLPGTAANRLGWLMTTLPRLPDRRLYVEGMDAIIAETAGSH
jgi:hypothetical protein